MEEQYSFDINLDFLDSSTTNTQQNAATTGGYQGQVQQFDIESLATRIASVNDLTIQLKAAKDEQAKLQKQMQDLSDSAMSIRCMYEREKKEKAKYALLSKELQEKCDQAESQLTNKTLHFEQLTSKMEQSAEKGPISYNELALRYQRLALQLDDDKLLNYKERPSLQQIQDYVESKKLTPLPSCKKKAHTIQRAEMKTQGTQYTSVEGTCADVKPLQKEMCTQGTQYTWYTTTRGTNTPAFKSPQKEVRTQGTQYISSTTTRGTCTSAFIKKQSIGTNFPEVVPVSIEDIFKEMIYDVSPLSPMFDGPHVEEELVRVNKIEMKSVSTNTGLKNVRKPIDYVPPSVKHSDSRPPSRNIYDRIKNESPFMAMPTMNPFVGLGLSASPMHSTVADLWNMLGHTIFALLQNGSASPNPMHTNPMASNDRMRNMSADMARRRERHDRSNFGKEYFDGEDLNSLRDYLPATRSTATSPISPSESSENYITGEVFVGTKFFDGTYASPAASPSSAFVPVARSGDGSQVEPNPPIEIQKILLNKSSQMDSNEMETRLEKSSRVDEILKLFPEYSQSLQKRKAIKRLLKTSNKERKSNKRSAVDGIQAQNMKPHEQQFGTSSEESIFSDEGSESGKGQDFKQSFDRVNSFRLHSASKQTSVEQFGTSGDESIFSDESSHSSNGETFRQSIEFPKGEDFLRLEEESHPLPSDEVFCKPFLPPKRRQPPAVSNPFQQNERIGYQQSQREGGAHNDPKLIKKAKRKRRSSTSDTKQSSKIHKAEESNSLPQRVAHSNSALQSQRTLQEKKPLMFVSQGRGISPLNSLPTPIQEVPPNSVLIDQRTSNLNDLPASRQFKPSNSILHKRRMQNLRGKITTSGKKFTVQDQGTLNSDGVTSQRLEEKSEGTLTFSKPPSPNIDPLDWDFNETYKMTAVTGLHDQNPLNFNDHSEPRHEKTPNSLIFDELPAPKKEKRVNSVLNAQMTSNCNKIIVQREEEPSTYSIPDQKTLNFYELPSLEQEESQNSVFQDQKTAAEQANSQLFILHDKRTSNSPGPSTPKRENHPQLVFQDKETAPEQKKPLMCILHDQIISNSPGLSAPKLVKLTNSGQERLIFNELLDSREEKPSNYVIPDHNPLDADEFPKLGQEQLSNSALYDQRTVNCNGDPGREEEQPSNTVFQNQEFLPLEQEKSSILLLENQGTERTLREREPSTEQRLANEAAAFLKNESPSTGGFSPTKSSDSEADLSIDCPESPKYHSNSALDLSSLLKTPEKNHPLPQFKTPDSCNRNNSISKVLTISTENLVEDFLLSDSPDTDGPKFQIFLDKILDEVAPPLSPISVLAPTEKTLNSEAESSHDEEDSKAQAKAVTSRKNNKKKPPATSAIAVKRSARLKAKKITDTGPLNSLSLLNIPGIQLGKYTKRRTGQKNSLKKLQETSSVKEEKAEEKVDIICDIRLGFFKDIMDEDVEHDSSKDELVIDDIPDAIRQPEDRLFKKTTEDFSIFQEITQQVSEKSKELCKTHMEPKSESILMLKSEEDHKRLPAIDSPSSSPFQENSPSHVEPKTLDDRIPFVDQNPKEFWPSSYKETKISDEKPKLVLEDPSPSFSSFNECPSSPPPLDQSPEGTHITQEFVETTPVTTNATSNSMISHIIANYNPKHHKMLAQVRNSDPKLLTQLQSVINGFLGGLCLVMDSIRTLDTLLNLTSSETRIAQAIVGIVKVAPRPETEVPPPVPELYLSQTLRKLLSLLEPLHNRLPNFRKNLQATIEQSLFTFTKDIIPLEVLMNLTQFYLAIIADPKASTNPARLFICKCLYFYNQKATPMIYETLCVYPSVLPKREDLTYDRSDALINTIQCLLVSTYYDMEKTDLKTREMFTKLRKFYNYESFKPPRDEVIENLMAKIRAGRFKNISYAFALICKRMEQKTAEKLVLAERLLPLANEYYHTLSQTTENDEKIACVLECISFIIKPFNVGTDISIYINLFGRFLNASEKRVIQEAALAALLRTIRFGYVHCFNAIYTFKPNYELTDATKAMLKSFVYKKNLDFLKRLEHQAHVLVTT